MHNIFTREISPDLLFQNKNPHDKIIIDPTSNSEYSNKNVLISSENSEPILVKNLKMTCCFYVNKKKAITTD